LPGHFCVWLSSLEADFLCGRFVWAVWDAEELKAKEDEIVKRDFLKMARTEWTGVTIA
jgi:hypothetical protein